MYITLSLEHQAKWFNIEIEIALLKDQGTSRLLLSSKEGNSN
jgi:hypothetical protein